MLDKVELEGADGCEGGVVTLEVTVERDEVEVADVVGAEEA